ncbi:MAG: hypothetical protein JWP89_6130 [Schlesneria sp.]|nr:hypothetical protein [Schlesneria sp.]
MKHEPGCGHDHDHDDDQHECSPEPVSETGTELFSGCDVQFRYPKGWEVQEEANEEQTTITVQSPGTAFWTLSLFEDRPDADEILASVMSAYEELYEELDVYEFDVMVLGAPAVAREFDFVCLDLVSSVSLMIFQTVKRTAMVLFQGEDRELEKARPVMEAMTRSLVCDVE